MRDAMSGPLSRRATGIDRLLGLVLFASLVALIAGLILPAITIRSMFLATDFLFSKASGSFSKRGLVSVCDYVPVLRRLSDRENSDRLGTLVLSGCHRCLRPPGNWLACCNVKMVDA